MTILPTFQGWTVDFRLKEFRKVEYEMGESYMVFVRFDTEQGDYLLTEMIKANLVPQEVLSRLF